MGRKESNQTNKTEPIDVVNILPPARFEPTTSITPPSTTPDIDATHITKKGCSGSAEIDDDQCSTHRILVPFQCMVSISFASESLMDPRIQV